MASMTVHAWSKIRQRLQQMIEEDNSIATPGSSVAQTAAFEDPTIQKFLRPLISRQGEEYAYEVFCNYFNNTVKAFFETGILSEDELMPANSGMAG